MSKKKIQFSGYYKLPAGKTGSFVFTKKTNSSAFFSVSYIRGRLV
jgi:hypothetical protein